MCWPNTDIWLTRRSLVELRLDYINGDVKLRRLVADRPCPAIISCRRTVDGGKYAGSEEQRQLLLRTAIAEGVEYVDLEDDVATSIRRFGKTKRIISVHDFRKTPDDLDEIHRRLCGLDPDIIKICTMANHPNDNLRMLEVARRSKVPTVGLCMGDIGIPTRILAGKFGAPFSYATFHHERVLAPGQLSFQQMTETYHYDQIDADTEVYGVVADPVGHSLSPLIHNVAFRHFKLNKVYIPIRVPREDLARFIDDAEAGHPRAERHDSAQGGGCQKADRGRRRRSRHRRRQYGHLRWEETAGLQHRLPSGDGQPRSHDRRARRGRTASGGQDGARLGAGGAGKAVVYGLTRRGVNVVVSDGVARQALTLAQRFNCRSIEWSARHSVAADLLFNCTPVGMHPNVDETPFEKHHLRPSMLVFDAVYNPENTLLVKEARSRNCTVVTGVDMFVRQACRQFELFTGKEGPADLMRETIRRAIGAAKY